LIIDFHTHVGDFRTPDQMDGVPVTWEELIRRLDREGIDRAVVLPLGASPESTQAPFLLAPNPDIMSQLEAAEPYGDRVILFGNLDPRMGGLGNLTVEQLENPPETDFTWILERFRELGCVGIGEVTANIPLDDPRMINLSRQCGRHDMPVLCHITGPGRGVYGLIDEVGSPRLERLLQAAREITVVGHSPGFWAEISGDATPEDKFIYPAGRVTAGGSLPRLLRTYPNLYADISARSGLNAIRRDRDFAVRFLKEFQDRILFGTDICFADAEGDIPTLSYLRELVSAGEIGPRVFDKITGENALRILPLYHR
jgi:predicted TIM-barrel fold metal-dependent hydrolase